MECSTSKLSGNTPFIIELGTLSDSEVEGEGQPSVARRTALSPSRKISNGSSISKTRVNRRTKRVHVSKRSSVQSSCSDSASSTVRKNVSAASHLKNTQRLLQENERSQTQPKITVNSQFRSPPRYSEYRKLGEIDECGPLCDCYYCALLNISSDSNDDEEGRCASDDEMDSIALAYGYPPTRPSQCNCSVAFKFKATQKTSSKPAEHQPKPKPSSNVTGTPAPADPLQLGDGLVKDPPKGPKAAGEFLHAKNCPSRTGIIKEMPQFIREFEDAMRKAREESISDSVFDALGFFLGAISSCFRFYWSRLTFHTPVKVAPAAPQTSTHSKLP